MSKKLGLVLGAGGSRGVAHVGLLKALDDAGIKPDYICGSSMGAVVGGCYAAGLKPSLMADVLLKLKPKDLMDISVNPIKNSALLRSKKIRKRLSEYLGDKTFKELDIPFSTVAVDLLTGGTKVFSGEEKVLDGVVASASIPAVFKPVKNQNQELVDGGVKFRLPVEQVRDMGAEVVVAVDVLGELRPIKEKKGIISVLLRMIDIYDSQITEFRLKEDAPNLLIRPNLGDMSQYKFKDLEKAYEAGYQTGKFYLDKIKALVE